MLVSRRGLLFAPWRPEILILCPLGRQQSSQLVSPLGNNPGLAHGQDASHPHRFPAAPYRTPTSVTWPSQHPPSHFLEDLCGLGRKFVPSDKAEDNEGGATRPEALREETVPASRSWTSPGDPARCHSAEAGHAWSLQVPPALPQPSYNAHRAAGSGFRQETA